MERPRVRPGTIAHHDQVRVRVGRAAERDVGQVTRRGRTGYRTARRRAADVRRRCTIRDRESTVATQHERWMRALESELPGYGIAHERLGPDEARDVLRQWRQSFAVRVYEATGHWVHEGFDWHVFSYGFAHALQGPPAEHAYRQAWATMKPPGVRRHFLLAARSAFDGEQVIYRCSSVEPPMLGSRDELIVPLDFSWTMAFTHEQGWLGPFFTTPEWARTAPPQETRQPANRRKHKGPRK